MDSVHPKPIKYLFLFCLLIPLLLCACSSTCRQGDCTNGVGAPVFLTMETATKGNGYEENAMGTERLPLLTATHMSVNGSIVKKMDVITSPTPTVINTPANGRTGTKMAMALFKPAAEKVMSVNGKTEK